MSAPEVTIVVPCYNGEAYVEETLGSALAQDLPALRVIVVDDGSTDGSTGVVERVAAADSRLSLVRQANAGVAMARNAGLAACAESTRYVMFLDADDVLVPGALGPLVDRLEADPSLVAAVGTVSRIDSDGRLLSPPEDPFRVREVTGRSVRIIESPDRIGYWRMIAITPISTPGQVVIRRAAITTGAAFDPATVPCEDWDLWLRLSRQGDFGFVPSQVLRYRDHVASASKGHAMMMRQRETVLRKQRDLVAEEERAALRAAWLYSMYRFDARLCRSWAAEQLGRRDFVGALRYATRSARLDGRLLVARLRGQPEVGAPQT